MTEVAIGTIYRRLSAAHICHVRKTTKAKAHLAGYRPEGSILCEAELCARADVHHRFSSPGHLYARMEDGFIEICNGARCACQPGTLPQTSCQV